MWLMGEAKKLSAHAKRNEAYQKARLRSRGSRKRSGRHLKGWARHTAQRMLASVQFK